MGYLRWFPVAFLAVFGSVYLLHMGLLRLTTEANL